MDRREYARRAVARYGLKVVCLGCGARGKVKLSRQTRLRVLRCKGCGLKGGVTALWRLKGCGREECQGCRRCAEKERCKRRRRELVSVQEVLGA